MIYNTKNKQYGSMPLWQWVVIYVVIALVIYGVVYYVFFPHPASYNYTNPQPQPQTQITAPSTASTVVNTSIATREDPVKGNILTDSNGMSLYVFDKDTVGVSNCTGGCLAIWPPLLVNLATQSNTLPDNLAVIKKTDGTSQYAWRGLPLYYYSKDTKPGDVLGDGFGGIWHLVHP